MKTSQGRSNKIVWMQAHLCILLILSVFLPSWVFASEPIASSEQNYVPVPSSAQAVARSQTMFPPKQGLPDPPHVLLKGQINYCVPKGTGIKLKLATVPTLGLHLMDRDLSGNLYPAQLGQEITAKVTEDLFVDENKVIPEGTIFHGRVSKIIAPKRMMRPGSLCLTFDQIITPDGRRFAFKAEANNTRESTPRSKARGFGKIMAHTAGGAVLGALVAYELFGLENTISMHGYNVAGGAAIGGIAATAYAMMKHGSPAVLEPGDDLNMEIDTDLLMPAAQEPVAKKNGTPIEDLEIEIVKSKTVKDGLDGWELRLEAVITNNTAMTINSIDLFLEDDNGTRFPVAAGDLDESELLFHIPPRTLQRVSFSFQLEYPKLKRKLVWIDHDSRKVLMSQRLP